MLGIAVARENAVLGRFRLALLVALVFSPLTTTAQADYSYCTPAHVNLVCNGQVYYFLLHKL